jgi:hypothetical protein
MSVARPVNMALGATHSGRNKSDRSMYKWTMSQKRKELGFPEMKALREAVAEAQIVSE